MTEGFVLRVATPDDAAALSEVLYASYSTVLSGWYSAVTLEVAARAMGRAQPALLASGRYFVALRNGRILGCGGWSHETPARRAQKWQPVLRVKARQNDELIIGRNSDIAPNDRGSGTLIPRLAHVRHFATHPEHLGEGVGGTILARCLFEAKRNGAVEIEALSTLAAEAFYAHKGFIKMADRKMSFGGAPFMAVLMRRRL